MHRHQTLDWLSISISFNKKRKMRINQKERKTVRNPFEMPER